MQNLNIDFDFGTDLNINIYWYWTKKANIAQLWNTHSTLFESDQIKVKNDHFFCMKRVNKVAYSKSVPYTEGDLKWRFLTLYYRNWGPEG